MKIICEHGELGHPYAATLQYCGHNVVLWQPAKSLIDLYDEISPDIILYEPQSKPLIDELINLKIVRCLTHETPIHYIPPANPVQLLGLAEEKYACDVVILDHSLPPQAKEFAEKLFEEGFRVKMFAQNLLRTPLQLGALTSYKEYGNALASCKFVLDITKRWQLDGWMNGKICLHEVKNHLDSLDGTVYNTVEDVVHICQFLLQNPKKYTSLVKQNRERVASNTYFQSIGQIFEGLGLTNEKELVLNIFDEKIRNLLS
jgi:hypothetical protein